MVVVLFEMEVCLLSASIQFIVSIKPDPPRTVDWTKVLIDTFASGGLEHRLRLGFDVSTTQVRGRDAVALVLNCPASAWGARNLTPVLTFCRS